MCTTRDAVRNGSTTDKVKDALDLNKNHATTAHTTGTHTTSTHATGTRTGYNGTTNSGPHDVSPLPLNCSTFSSLLD